MGYWLGFQQMFSSDEKGRRLVGLFGHIRSHFSQATRSEFKRPGSLRGLSRVERLWEIFCQGALSLESLGFA